MEKRGPGRPRVTDRPVKDGNPKVQFRIAPERRAWLDSRGGDAFAKAIVEEYWNRSIDAVTPELIEEFKYSAALDLLPSLRPTDPDDGCEGMVGLVGEVSSEEARDLEKRVAALGYKSSATYVDEEDGIRTWWLWVL